MEFWQGFVAESRMLPKKYKNNGIFYPFASKMSLKLVDEISQRADELHICKLDSK